MDLVAIILNVVAEDASMLELHPLKVIHYTMLSKWTYLSVLTHPHDDIHHLVEVDCAGNWISVYELNPSNGIQLLQRICNAGLVGTLFNNHPTIRLHTV
jgi:hypothetical protein